MAHSEQFAIDRVGINHTPRKVKMQGIIDIIVILAVINWIWG